jgi:hypothetical protein
MAVKCKPRLKLTKDDVTKFKKLNLSEQDVKSVRELNLTCQDVQSLRKLNLSKSDVVGVEAGAETVRVQAQPKVTAQVKPEPIKPIPPPPPPPAAVKPVEPPITQTGTKASLAQNKVVPSPTSGLLPKDCVYSFVSPPLPGREEIKVYGIEVPPCIRNVAYRPIKGDDFHGFNLSLAWPRTLWNICLFRNRSMLFAVNRISKPFVKNGLNTELYILGMPNVEVDGRMCTGNTLSIPPGIEEAKGITDALNIILNSRWNESIGGAYKQVGLENILDWHTLTAKHGSDAYEKIKLSPAHYPTVEKFLSAHAGITL